VTGGPEVNDRLETSLPGVYACGNVLHVHDLVDYVSEEATLAGKNAAAYVRDGKMAGECLEAVPSEIPVAAKDGVRYTVPQKIDPERMEEKLVVRFRVGDVYRGKAVCVYYGTQCVQRLKKKVLAPGEMEQVILTKESLLKAGSIENITVCLEDA